MADRELIDLRSDTVTRPSPAMRRAMAEADVGDDVFGEDPSLNRLQEVAAETFGREAGLFVPSGTMGNLIAIDCHTSPGQEVICEGRSHVYNYEMASMAAVAGVMPRVVDGDDGIMAPESIIAAIRPKTYYVAQTGLVCLENTHNMCGGSVYPVELCETICAQAHEAGLPVHLDGARVFNAAVALERPVAEITRSFDSVMFCFSKGLGAPVGSMLVGSKEFIEKARRVRKRLGGGMRQAGVLAAAAMVALSEGPGRLAADHANAKFLAQRLSKLPGIEIDPNKVRTNIVIFDVAGAGTDSATFLARLAEAGTAAIAVGPTAVRMVTHCDVSADQVERAVMAVERILT